MLLCNLRIHEMRMPRDVRYNCTGLNVKLVHRRISANFKLVIPSLVVELHTHMRRTVDVLFFYNSVGGPRNYTRQESKFDLSVI